MATGAPDAFHTEHIVAGVILTANESILLPLVHLLVQLSVTVAAITLDVTLVTRESHDVKLMTVCTSVLLKLNLLQD